MVAGRQSSSMIGHILGTPRHKPRQSHGMTTNVIPQLVADSTSWS
jgi:hypothetical protein